MPPVMLDFRSPLATRILEPDQSRPTSSNPNEAQISSSFDRVGAPPANSSSKHGGVSMDRSADDAGVSTGFGNTSPLPSFSSSMKLNALTGASRPRKTRRRRGKPASLAPRFPGSAVRNEGVAPAYELREKMDSWNPFASKSNLVPEDPFRKGEERDSASEYLNRDSPSNSRAGSFDSTESQGSDFISNAQSSSSFDVKDDMPHGRDSFSRFSDDVGKVSMWNEGILPKKQDIPSSAHGVEGSFSELRNKMGELDLSSTSRVNMIRMTNTFDSSSNIFEERVFVFGGSTSSSSHGRSANAFQMAKESSDINKTFSVDSNVDFFSKLPNDVRKSNLPSSENDKQLENRRHDVQPSNCSFSTSETNLMVEKCSSNTQSSFSYLPDGMRKLNLQNSLKEDGPENMKMADGHGKTGGNKFIFGSRKTESNASASASLKDQWNNDGNSQATVMQSDSVPSSGLSDELQKLNLNISGCENTVGSTAKDYFSHMSDGANTFLSGSSKKAPALFSSVGSSEPVDKGCSNLQDKLSNLPDVLRKVSLHDSVKEDKLEKAKHNDENAVNLVKVDDVDQVKPIDRHFKDLGSNAKTEPTIHGAAHQLKKDHQSQATSVLSGGIPFSSLPIEMQKLNLSTTGAAYASDDKRQGVHGHNHDGSNTFIFGSNNNVTEAYCANFDNQFENVHKSQESCHGLGAAFVNIPEKLISPTSSSVGSLEKMNQDNHSSRINGGNMFFFKSSKGAHNSSKKSMLNKVPRQIRNLDIKNETLPNETDDESNDNNKEPTSVLRNNLHPCCDETLEGKTDCSTYWGFQSDGSTVLASSESFKSGSFETLSSHLPSSHLVLQFPATNVTLKSKDGEFGPSYTFNAPTPDTSSVRKENLFSSGHMEYRTKKGVAKNSKVKKKRDKLKHSGEQHVVENFASTCDISMENSSLEFSGGYSPMDCSPYEENLVVDREPSREVSAASDEGIHANLYHIPINAQNSAILDEKIVSATQNIVISDCDSECSGPENDGLGVHVNRAAMPELEVQDCGRPKGSFGLTTEITDPSDDDCTANAEADDANSNFEAQPIDFRAFTLSSSKENTRAELNFTFAASTSAPSLLSSSNHQSRRGRMKPRREACPATRTANPKLSSSPPISFQFSSTSINPGSEQHLKDVPFVAQSNEVRIKLMTNPVVKEECEPAAVVQECENWRLRGNEAYACSHFSKAENYYTCGINSLSNNEPSRDGVRVLMLCYSNRAATRMSLGRMREALSDCLEAAAIDPSFLKARIRAANCHLALGEVADALKIFKQCLQLVRNATMDQKIYREAIDGLQKTEKLASLVEQSSQLLRRRTSTDAMMALQLISEALVMCPYSENLIEMKAVALLMMQKYEEACQLCEQTLDSSERNFVSKAYVQHKNGEDADGMTISPMKIWRWHIMAKSYFYLGKLEDALELLQKHEQANLLLEKSYVLSGLTSATVSELLRRKAAGNDDFQVGRHLQAVEQYTAALSCSTESYPFAAICFCNRAAAYQNLSQMTDAIADCSIAMALDSSYIKAISRRATLHELIRDYDQSSKDLSRLISLLDKKTDEDHKSAPSKCLNNDLKQVHLRLSRVEEEARIGTPMNLYMILGIKPSSSSSDVRKAYHKAALRHHPDKAGQFLSRRENIDDAQWRELTDEVHKDADRLFKTILEAYTTLSDSSKRQQYDAEEEMRLSLNKGFDSRSSPKAAADSYSGHDRSGGKHLWKSSGDSRRQWSGYYHSSRYF